MNRLGVLLSFVLFLAACGGESSTTGDDDSKTQNKKETLREDDSSSNEKPDPKEQPKKPALPDTDDSTAAKVEDMSRLRTIVGLLEVSGFRYKFDSDDRVDVFGVLLSDIDPERDIDIVNSARFRTKVTTDQLRKKDYSNVSWARYQRYEGGPKHLKGHSQTVPLIWDKRPDGNGGRLMALSGGAVRWYKESEAQAVLKKAGQWKE